MVEREYDYIKGNTVSAPERKSRVRKPDKKNRQIQRRKNRSALLKNRRKNDRKYILTMAMIIFTFGFITISGDSKVYNMQKKVSDLNTQIKQTEEGNEALKVKMLKFSSLTNIQGNAGSKLAMFIPSKEEVVKIDFSENYFKDIKPSNIDNNNKSKTFYSKLVNLIK